MANTEDAAASGRERRGGGTALRDAVNKRPFRLQPAAHAADEKPEQIYNALIKTFVTIK